MAGEMIGENKRKYATISSSSCKDGVLNDDESSDEEFLNMKVDFSQSSSRENRPPASSQSTEDTTDNANTKSRISVEDIINSSSSSVKAAEEDARNKILSNPQILHKAKDVDYDLGQLFWHLEPPRKRGKRPRKQPNVYPCFRLKPKQGKCLDLYPKDSQMCVCYMGYGSTLAGISAVVPKTQLVPMVEEETGKISSKNMTMFLQTSRKKDPQDNEEFNLVMEKVVLEELVKLCQEEKGKKQELTTTLKDEDDGNGDTNHKENDKGEDGADDETSLTDVLSDNNNNRNLELADVNHDDQSTPDQSTPDHNRRKVKQQTIRAGCIIRYCPPLAVAGTDAEKVCQVHKVMGKGDFALELGNGDVLDRDHRVQLVQEMFRGKLVKNKHPKYQEVDQYRLPPSEMKGKNPLEQKVEGFKSVMRNCRVATNDKCTAALAQDLLHSKFNSEDQPMNDKIADSAAEVSSSHNL